MKRNVLLFTFATGAALWLSPAIQGQVIRLKTQVNVDSRSDVRLGDLATITGTDPHTAEELSNTVILSNVEATRTVKAESVLMALISQRGGAGMGMALQLGGASQCTVTVAGRSTATRLEAAVPAPVPSNTAPALGVSNPPAAAVVSASPTLAQLLLERIRQETGRTAEQLDVSIETISPLLEAPVAANRRWYCRPLMRTLIGTVQFEAQLVEGQRTVEKLNVQTKVKWQKMAIVATGKIDRGDLITAAMVQMKEQWVDRELPTLFGSEKDVIGLEATRALDIGAMLDQRDFKPALMAAKGDAISVIYMNGSLTVQMHARATQDGKLHDQVQVRNESTGEVYQATLIGKRLAVVGGTLSEAEEKQLRETR